MQMISLNNDVKRLEVFGIMFHQEHSAPNYTQYCAVLLF